MASPAELVVHGAEFNATVVLVVLAASLLLLALQVTRQRKAQAAVDSGRALRRKMSNIGVSTLVSETETNLSIPVSLLSLGGKITVEEFTQRLQERMSADPFFHRFRSLVVGQDKTFVEVEHFDVSRHVKTHALREGETPTSFLESIVNKPLDFSKPLWEIHVVLSDDDDVTHFAWKVHHCIGDGHSLSVALIRLSDNKVQFDKMIEKMEAARKSEKKEPKPVSAKLKELIGLIVLCVWSTYVIVRKLGVLVFRSEPATVFKRPGGTQKKLSHNMLYSVAETKRVGKKFNATINDVMLSCVAGAMRRALLATGATVSPGLVVRAAIPVDMRGTNEVVKDARNKFSALCIDFPVGLDDPQKRLKAIRGNMNEAKNSLEKWFTYWTSHLVAQLPEWLMKPAIQFATSRISVAISNVRGSAFSLAICDKPLKGYYGFVPPPPTVNLGVCALSVGGELGLNVLVDPNVGIDGKDFLRFAKEEFDELVAMVDAASPEDKKQQ